MGRIGVTLWRAGVEMGGTVGGEEIGLGILVVRVTSFGGDGVNVGQIDAVTEVVVCMEVGGIDEVGEVLVGRGQYILHLFGGGGIGFTKKHLHLLGLCRSLLLGRYQ